MSARKHKHAKADVRDFEVKSLLDTLTRASITLGSCFAPIVAGGLVYRASPGRKYQDSRRRGCSAASKPAPPESIGAELGLGPASHRDGVVRPSYSKRRARLVEKLLLLGSGNSGKNTISMWKAAEAGNNRVMPTRRLNKVGLVGVLR